VEFVGFVSCFNSDVFVHNQGGKLLALSLVSEREKGTRMRKEKNKKAR
jgi:hypothetical protein